MAETELRRYIAAKVINLVEVRTVTSTLHELGAKFFMAPSGNKNSIQRNPVSSFHTVWFVSKCSQKRLNAQRDAF